jgi:hypothetical protein
MVQDLAGDISDGAIGGKQSRWEKGDGHGETNVIWSWFRHRSIPADPDGTVVADGLGNLMAAPGSKGAGALLDQALCELRGSPASA